MAASLCELNQLGVIDTAAVQALFVDSFSLLQGTQGSQDQQPWAKAVLKVMWTDSISGASGVGNVCLQKRAKLNDQFEGWSAVASRLSVQESGRQSFKAQIMADQEAVACLRRELEYEGVASGLCVTDAKVCSQENGVNQWTVDVGWTHPNWPAAECSATLELWKEQDGWHAKVLSEQCINDKLENAVKLLGSDPDVMSAVQGKIEQFNQLGFGLLCHSAAIRSVDSFDVALHAGAEGWVQAAGVLVEWSNNRLGVRGTALMNLQKADNWSADDSALQEVHLRSAVAAVIALAQSAPLGACMVKALTQHNHLKEFEMAAVPAVELTDAAPMLTEGLGHACWSLCARFANPVCDQIVCSATIEACCASGEWVCKIVEQKMESTSPQVATILQSTQPAIRAIKSKLEATNRVGSTGIDTVLLDNKGSASLLFGSDAVFVDKPPKWIELRGVTVSWASATGISGSSLMTVWYDKSDDAHGGWHAEHMGEAEITSGTHKIANVFRADNSAVQCILSTLNDYYKLSSQGVPELSSLAHIEESVRASKDGLTIEVFLSFADRPPSVVMSRSGLVE